MSHIFFVNLVYSKLNSNYNIVNEIMKEHQFLANKKA